MRESAIDTDQCFGFSPSKPIFFLSEPMSCVAKVGFELDMQLMIPLKSDTSASMVQVIGLQACTASPVYGEVTY